MSEYEIGFESNQSTKSQPSDVEAMNVGGHVASDDQEPGPSTLQPDKQTEASKPAGGGFWSLVRRLFQR